MPGRPDFSQSGTAGGGQTVAVTNRPEVEGLNSDQTGSVAAGATETVEIYAPTGALYHVRAMTLNVGFDGTATSGTHEFQVRTAGNIRALIGEANFDAKIAFEGGIWTAANTKQQPSTEAGQVATLINVEATENEPVKVLYTNNTDAAQDNDRLIRLTVEEVSY